MPKVGPPGFFLGTVMGRHGGTGGGGFRRGGLEEGGGGGGGGEGGRRPPCLRVGNTSRGSLATGTRLTERDNPQ